PIIETRNLALRIPVANHDHTAIASSNHSTQLRTLFEAQRQSPWDSADGAQEFESSAGRPNSAIELGPFLSSFVKSRIHPSVGETKWQSVKRAGTITAAEIYRMDIEFRREPTHQSSGEGRFA